MWCQSGGMILIKKRNKAARTRSLIRLRKFDTSAINRHPKICKMELMACTYFLDGPFAIYLMTYWVFWGIDLDASFSSTKGNINHSTFVCHKRGQCLHFININIITKPNTYEKTHTKLQTVNMSWPKEIFLLDLRSVTSTFN